MIRALSRADDLDAAMEGFTTRYSENAIRTAS
jgi:hypothetical protein